MIKFFNHVFHFYQAFFMPLKSSFFENFQKIKIKNQRDGFYILLRYKPQELRQFVGIFLYSQNK